MSEPTIMGLTAEGTTADEFLHLAVAAQIQTKEGSTTDEQYRLVFRATMQEVFYNTVNVSPDTSGELLEFGDLTASMRGSAPMTFPAFVDRPFRLVNETYSPASVRGTEVTVGRFDYVSVTDYKDLDWDGEETSYDSILEITSAGEPPRQWYESVAVQPQIRKKNNSKTQDERRQDMRVTLGYNLCNPEQAVGPSEALLENMAAKTTLTATFNGSAEDVLIVPFSGRGFKLTGESYTVAQGEGSQMYNVRLQYLSRSTWADVDWD